MKTQSLATKLCKICVIANDANNISELNACPHERYNH